jgi:hypothetical protein
MNKIVASGIAIGAGLTAYNLMRNNRMPNRQMKRLAKQIRKMF